jgi:hypothetical protein
MAVRTALSSAHATLETIAKTTPETALVPNTFNQSITSHRERNHENVSDGCNNAHPNMGQRMGYKRSGNAGNRNNMGLDADARHCIV